MTVSLDDAERRRLLASPLWGDRWVETHAAIPVELVDARHREAPILEPTEDPLPSRSISLDGDWLLKGASPAREYSIDRWIPGAPADVKRLPVGWHLESTDRADWIIAKVPGTVQGALVEAGLMADPLVDANTFDELTEHGVPAHWPWNFRRTRVEQQEWWYARRFSVPAAWRGQRIRLAFDGIDYAASVYLNGEPVARHSGMYGGPDIDVSSVLRYDAENEVVVRVDPPPRDWHGVMKPSPGWGWHYGHLISSGIWRSVSLELVPDTELADVFVSTDSASDQVARVRIEWDVVRQIAESSQIPVSIVVTGPDGRVQRSVVATVATAAGTTRHAVELDIDSPELWWPFGYGAQPLYRVELSTNAVAVATQSRAHEFGIRTVEYRPVAGQPDPELYDWQLVINGRPIFVKGANWCFTDPLARRGFEIDEHILDLVLRANVQMLRAWGGGTIESDRFYEECDRRGILVWQEFPLNFGLDSTGADLATLDEQASRILRRLRNHPSLVMWGGGNENPETITSDDLLTLVGKRATQYDPTRTFHRTDPWGGSEHYYGVYHEGLPFEAYTEHEPIAFGEYGLSSQCDIESMARFMDVGLLEQWPPVDHGAIVQHQPQFSLFDFVKLARYAHYGPLTDWPTFIEYSQIAQGDALRMVSERMRARSGEGAAGYWFYKIGELFPGASWAVIDYYGRPKLSYYRAAQFCAPVSTFAVSPSTTWNRGERFRAAIHASNDSPVDIVGGQLRATLYDARFAVLAEESATVDVAADGRVDPFAIEHVIESDAVAPLVLSVQLKDATGERLSSAWYWFNAQPKSDELRELESLGLQAIRGRSVAELLAPYAVGSSPLKEQPRTTLTARVVDDRIVIENIGRAPAPIVIVDGFPYALGAWLEDNGFGLETGERRELRFDAPGGDLSSLSVRAWNADRVDCAG